MNKLLWPISLLLICGFSAALGYLLSHHRGLVETEMRWQKDNPPKVTELGTTKSLQVLPLVNWYTTNDSLQGEMGVSYLIRTDNQTLLFDLGQNAAESDPSPLEHNMKTLGISLDEVDGIFLSHNHFDHVGGKNWSRNHSFGFGLHQPPLGNKSIYTPIPMSYPGSAPINTREPQVLNGALATTGTIERQLFMGPIEEQSLVINVENKGLVLIVGCGHQTLSKLIERTQKAFSEPIYGMIGDLHYPIPEGRMTVLGINAQRSFASGDWPWRPLAEQDVANDIDLLRSLELGVIGLGSHDSSDQVVEQFAETFKSIYEPVIVGRWINIAPE